MDYSEILTKLTVLIETPYLAFGTGILWCINLEKEQYAILTCKHNLCNIGGDTAKCKINCDKKNCDHLINYNKLTLTSPFEPIAQSCLVSEDSDLAIINVSVSNVGVLKEIFTEKAVLYPLADEIKEYNCAFHGYPKALRREYQLGNTVSIKGAPEISNKEKFLIDIEPTKPYRIGAIQGLSGSGATIENKYGVLFLIGIVSNYFESVFRFKAVNPYEFLKNNYPDFEDFRPITNLLHGKSLLILKITNRERRRELLIEQIEIFEERIMHTRHRPLVQLNHQRRLDARQKELVELEIELKELKSELKNL